MQKLFEISEKEYNEITEIRHKKNIPVSKPRRKDGESFWDFIERGHDLLVEENPEIIECLKVKCIGNISKNNKKK